MTDIYELARPIRDAAMAEIERLTAAPDFCPTAKAANILGTHLSAVLMAFTADRHKQTGGLVRDEGLRFILPAAIATAVTNAAMSFRPFINGQPMPASAVAQGLLHEIAIKTMEQVALNEQGMQDFVIAFQRSETGNLEVKPFDYTEMLKGKP